MRVLTLTEGDSGAGTERLPQSRLLTRPSPHLHHDLVLRVGERLLSLRGGAQLTEIEHGSYLSLCHKDTAKGKK